MDVYFLDTIMFEDPLIYESAYREANEERRKKLDRFRFEQDKRLSLGAGLLLKRALTDKGVKDMELARMTNGKPYLKNCKAWHFNLSHSGTVAMCVIAGMPVGCDIERIGNPPLKIERRVFSKEEQAVLSGLENEAQRRYFYTLWTAKESFLKLTGEGLRTMPDDLTVSLPLGTQMVRGGLVSFFDVACSDAYQATVCAAGDVRNEQITVNYIE